ncbi:hypothetical protein HHI36_022805 [Cryptolaemus montrouzieri]|uniref:Chitin-binding type-2 domain-containing protein n=1 Tax=Cryptolaemus montrouzieri TaxID=559131 RepID=A0ABD2PFX3_9CUCU
MKCFDFILLMLTFGGTWRLSRPTCVLESDFGFTINCAFKKSGLFRVRNLGGVKAHIGLGFTLGDELGFKESISNVEINNRRRSAQASKLEQQIIKSQLDGRNIKSVNAIPSGVPIAVLQGLSSQSKKKNSTTILTVPPFKPIPPETSGSKQVVPAEIVGIAIPSTMLTPDTVKTKVIKSSPSSDKLSSTDFSIRTAPAPVPSFGNRYATNLTGDDLDLAILRKQQQIFLSKSKKTVNTSPKSSTPAYNQIASSIGKVMNAPKEYYPVGYDKNFDDNFASRVELPETSFYCGDQKHFPGLYADEDLGCMVFHVCALTDDGLIMKSFLCPESTLFDQTILKCNWWFYVDSCSIRAQDYDFDINAAYEGTFGALNDASQNSGPAPPKKQGFSAGSGLRSIAEGSFNSATDALNNQDAAGHQAAFVAKNTLAQAAAGASATAQAALAGKQILLQGLEQQLRDAQQGLMGEQQQLMQAQRAADTSMQAAQEARAHVNVLQNTLNAAQAASDHMTQAASEAAGELAAQQAMVGSAMDRLSALKKQLDAVRIDFEATRAAAQRAQFAAQTAAANAAAAAAAAAAGLTKTAQGAKPSLPPPPPPPPPAGSNGGGSKNGGKKPTVGAGASGGRKGGAEKTGKYFNADEGNLALSDEHYQNGFYYEQR